MKRGNRIFNVSVLLLLTSVLFAKGPEVDPTDKPVNKPSLAAGCVPAVKIVYLEFNNVRTRVETGGLWWQDRPNGVADYEVPKGSNSFAIYAGGLWMAGTDVNGQLKAAASLFGNGGVDYWTGPLDDDGTAEINEETCRLYDRFFETNRQDIQEFVLYNQVKDNVDLLNKNFPEGYTVPQSIKDWPGNSAPNTKQDFNLAPFVDMNDDGLYDWEDGDYPFYDIPGAPKGNKVVLPNGTIDCRAPRASRSESSTRPLFGDKNYWWIFNDKGNLHTETNAPSIGMEIHAQAFAFATNDAVNDMTFYNFELINRSTFTLTDTYFASYVDPDLGNSSDDYVGCDVARGLGYCYNGDDFDESVRGQTGYGSTPAVIGIDFFEGPYQDADSIDNQVGILDGEALNGLGYSDSIIDNERFGMRRFVYYNIGSGQNGDPSLAIHYYNYMRGIWQNGQSMLHGGNGLNSAGVEQIPTAFMFPGDSDPLHWGTTFNNVTTVPNNLNWTEDNPGGGQTANPPGDRRFLQSAGPFTLEPGNVNDITVGVVFAQAETGGRLESVAKIFTADDKAQSLFDNCFQVLNGPDAPLLTIQELDQELILYLDNVGLSNNVDEKYTEFDPNIITPDTIRQILGRDYDAQYKFQGYQIFQVKDNDISVSELYNPEVSRLAFQVDISDNVSRIVNYTFDDELGANVPQVMVDGANEGIAHSFRVTEDLFASGDRNLVNFKTYYYIAIAYGYNNYKTYLQDVAPDLSNVLAPASDGQKLPYISSRRGPSGGGIESVSAIPHVNKPQEGGTIINSSYGDLIGITRLQGRGNGGNAVSLTDATINRLMEEKAWETNIPTVELDYKLGLGPINVKVIDPLNMIDGNFILKFIDEDQGGTSVVTDTCEWFVVNVGGGPDGSNDTVFSDRTISTLNEQLIPRWGISINIGQGLYPGIYNSDNEPIHPTNGYLGSILEYKDPTRAWANGITDLDNQSTQDWILSGSVDGDRRNSTSDFIDFNSDFENILGGSVAPYGLVAYGIGSAQNVALNRPGVGFISGNYAKLEYLNSVALILTKDKSKWTRCPVVEMQEEPSKALNGDDKYDVRTMPSVDKEGNPWVPGTPTDLNDPESSTYIDSVGMGWFPGYAINQETGERMNIAFGEDSWYGVDNGADMVWNPTSTIISGVGTTNPVWGGKHVVYVFRKSLPYEEHIIAFPPSFRPQFSMNAYDGGKKLIGMLRGGLRDYAWGACSWVVMPVLASGQELLATDVRIDVQVSRPFDTLRTDVTDTTMISGQVRIDSSKENDGRPVYAFKTDGFAVRKGVTQVVKDELDRINVVPNPYYAISEYEESAVDNLIKITNLPEICTIRIYNMSGTLIRTFNKGGFSPSYLDWDLKNEVGIPISSGVYIIHVNVPDVGEKVIKWFGVMRPVDLNNF